MRINNFLYLLKEGIRHIFTHGFMSFAAVCVTVACLIIVGSVLLGWGFNKLCSWAFRPISKNKKQKAS